jgi:diguanylate cyclase (GGDEF)-like protein
MVRALAQQGAWLGATEVDRNRLLDMTRRLLGATLFASALCALAVYPLLSAVGPTLLVPLAIGSGGQIAIGLVFPRLSRPERWILGGDCLSVIMISWGVALSGGLESPLLALLVLPLLSVAGRHTPLVFAYFVVLTVCTPLLAALVSINHHMNDPTAQALSDLAAIGGSAAIIIALMRAEWQFRHQSLLDPLTGLLNRLALQRRFEELRTQAALSGAEVCMVIGDIDHFKRINDEYGHDCGDGVLAEVADALRTNMRSFSLLYRLGGEEFLAVLPGLDVEQGAALAGRLREAVQERRPRGIDVTISFGVAAARGVDVVFDTMFAEADRRLYEAKRTGRNRIAPGSGEAPPSSFQTVPRRRSTIGLPQAPAKSGRAVSPGAPGAGG